MSMRETGIVESASGNEAVVLFSRTDACKQCGACAKGEDGSMRMTLKNDIGAKAGDPVAVELPESRLIQAGLLIYGLPLLALLLGLMLGYYALPLLLPGWDRNILAIILALALGGLSMLCLYWTEKRRRRAGRYMPRAVLISPQDNRTGGTQNGQ